MSPLPIGSEPRSDVPTSHALLVPWGLFAQQIGLVAALTGVPVAQRERDHPPQRKLIQFQVAILAGCPYLQDISRAPHPLDEDAAVAEAWGQPRWADYSGISRTLKACTTETVEAVRGALASVSRPFVDREVMLALRDEGMLVYDGDLTGRPVSSTATSYAGAAFGWMDDAVRLGYQAALVSLRSPTYGRLWLSVKQLPGDTVSSSQAQAMVLAAEASTGVRPRRRTELLVQRIARERLLLEEAIAEQRQAEARLTQAAQQLAAGQEEHCQASQALRQLENTYQAKERSERPHSLLSQARRRLVVWQERLGRRERAVARAEPWLERCQRRLTAQRDEGERLQQRLARLEKDNAGNRCPIQAIFRLDAGFGSSANLAWLIEMGYDVYTKANSDKVVQAMRRKVAVNATWTPVGKNAEMVTWQKTTVADCPYPLDVGLERFYTGRRVQHAVLLHYGAEQTASDPVAWFTFYNKRQTIEAGIKEGNGAFQMHHLKVRSPTGLAIQEEMTAFAANFVRWAAEWLQTNSASTCAALRRTQESVTQSVRVAANTSAYVIWQSQGCLLRFTEHSLFRGAELVVGNCHGLQLAMPLFKSCALVPI